MPSLFGPGQVGHITVDDLSGGGAVTVDFRGLKINLGEHFFFADFATMGNNETLLIVATVPEESRAHFNVVVRPSGVLTVNIFEGVTGISGGTPIVANNTNRNSPITSVLTAKLNPTATLGTKLASFKWGTSSDGGFLGAEAELVTGDGELILRGGISYAWELVSGSSNNTVNYRVNWHE